LTCAAVAILTGIYGWPAAQAQAVDRYLYRESRCLGHPPVQPRLCGGPCYGAFQWDSQRWHTAVAWMRGRSLDPWSIEAQVHYAVHEWLTRWPRASARFARAPTAGAAFAIWRGRFGNGKDDQR
jgi:hypothetical protein